MNAQISHIQDLISKGKRIDGRNFKDFRKIEIEKNPIPNAEGSARVKFGDTEVIVGVKMSIGEPFPDTPNDGVLMVGSELSPLAHPSFELGPPREGSIELARVVDRGIRESKALDTEKLCITKGEKVWMVFVDIWPINHDGNLIDASGLAAITALLNAKIPKIEGDKIIYEEKKDPLKIRAVPIPVTLAKIKNQLLIDPDIREEEAMEARLTVSSVKSGNICALQKGGVSGLKMEEIENALELSVEKGKELRKIIEK